MKQFLYFFRPQLKLVHSAESVFIYYICLVLYLLVIYETIFSNFILYFGQWGGRAESAGSDTGG